MVNRLESCIRRSGPTCEVRRSLSLVSFSSGNFPIVFFHSIRIGVGQAPLLPPRGIEGLDLATTCVAASSAVSLQPYRSWASGLAEMGKRAARPGRRRCGACLEHLPATVAVSVLSHHCARRQFQWRRPCDSGKGPSSVRRASPLLPPTVRALRILSRML